MDSLRSIAVSQQPFCVRDREHDWISPVKVLNIAVNATVKKLMLKSGIQFGNITYNITYLARRGLKIKWSRVKFNRY